MIHPLIPVSDITSVADIATGNGSVIVPSNHKSSTEYISSWLEDAHAELSPLTFSELRLDGFDIASGLFPEKGNGKYAVQDITKPFPPEYHGVYDLVHIRYLTIALPAEKYLPATRNVVKLLSK